LAGARKLGERDLNRALLARQLLLERTRSSIPKTLERMGGMQAQYAPSMYIGLSARIDGFERAQLDRALERRSVVQGTLMRATIHLVSAADYWPIALGIRRARRDAWLGASYRSEYSAAQMSTAARRLRSRLGDGTIARKDILELLGSDSVITNGVNMWLDLVRVPPSGTWERRRADLYAAAEHWLGPPPKIDDWAGIHPRWLAPALERLELRSFEAEEGGELVDLPRAPLPDPETPAPVRLLPTWDATLLAHARRTGILPEEDRPKVFNPRTPHSVPTFLVDGRVAGTWRHEKGKVSIDSFGRLDQATRRQLRRESERLAELHR
jgi:winged helix DNA-binding protein